MKKIEYSQIVRCKLKTLKIRLTSEFGLEVSRRALKRITKAVRGLADFEENSQYLLCTIWNVITDIYM